MRLSINAHAMIREEYLVTSRRVSDTETRESVGLTGSAPNGEGARELVARREPQHDGLEIEADEELKKFKDSKE